MAQLDASVRAVYELAAFSETEKKTLKLIADYLRYRRENSGPDKPPPRCFTYRGLRWYWDTKRLHNGLEWHTAERVVRKLAQLGWLSRRILPHRGVKHVVFCLTSNLEYILEKLGWLK